MKLLQGGQAVRRIEILNDPALQVDCPICEEKRGLRCYVQPGVARFDSHFERKELAQEKMIQRVVESKEVSILGRTGPRKKLALTTYLLSLDAIRCGECGACHLQSIFIVQSIRSVVRRNTRKIEIA